MTNKDLSYLNPTLDKMKKLVDALNKSADETGDIHKNMHDEIWSPYLHQWNHEDICLMLTVLNEVELVDDTMLDWGHDDTIQKVTEYVQQGIQENLKRDMLGKQKIKNFLDKEYKGPKKQAYWKFACSIREIWNNVTGEDHPLWAKNKKSKQSHLLDKTTVFTSPLFTRH
jgi:hypothetical protein